MPEPGVVAANRRAMVALRPSVSAQLRAGRLLAAVEQVDEVLLIGELGMSRSDVVALREQYRELSARRTARGRRVQL